jgi:uncharacterized membrane protein
MAEDKWYSIINDELDDIPARVEKMKKTWKRFMIMFFVIIVVGFALMSLPNCSAWGCFVALSAIVLLCVLAVAGHNQLCMYRVILEMRKAGAGSSSGK